MRLSMLNTNLDELNYVVFDTETTGLSPQKGARLVEIAAVKISSGLNLDLSETFESLINPCVPIPYQAYRVHGIDDSMVRDKPKAGDVIPSFFNFCADSIVLAHNANFDGRFVDYQAEKDGIANIMTKLVCSVKLTKTAYPGLDKYSLDYLINHFELDLPLPDGYRHRALFDAAHTGLLIIRCIRQLKRNGIFTLGELLEVSPKSFIKWA